jgi:hypothetical protein
VGEGTTVKVDSIDPEAVHLALVGEFSARLHEIAGG